LLRVLVRLQRDHDFLEGELRASDTGKRECDGDGNGEEK
jgi:hypothetical protein